MATARKLPSGNFRVRVFSHKDANGKKIYKSFTASDKKQAELMAAEYSYDSNKLDSNMTFGEALDKYISSRSSVLSPSTIVAYKKIRRSGIQELMDVKLKEIDQECIQKVVNNDAKNHSPKTVRNNHGIISAVLKQYKPNLALHTVLPKKVRPSIYIPSESDMKRIMTHIKGTDMELPVLLAAFGPMRRGEIGALKSSNITGNIVHVCSNKVRNEKREWVIKSPKTYAGDRYIPYPDFVAEKWKGIEGYIVKLHPDEITENFAKILDDLELTHFRFHDLRHYSASILHALGIPDQYIMERGGWGNDNVLKEVYRHAMEKESKKANDKANDYFSKMYDTKYDTK